ncbi:P-loop containing nucleoside triphosphate hydrolase protein [Hyaloraphidium curvatum]|nr:P-loop containing nucleoside triphosphate hydrolase protein [Hyaloraphidium curvatum]
MPPPSAAKTAKAAARLAKAAAAPRAGKAAATRAPKPGPGPRAAAAPAPLVPPLSAEQALVVDALRGGKNAAVDAVAGSGKTTTILQIAAAFPDKRVLAVLYNRRLKYETKTRAAAARVTNLAVDNYHGFAFRNYSDECLDDHGLERVVHDDLPLRRRDKNAFDILCLDEVQDMTPLLFRLVRKLVRDAKRPRKPLQYVLLGDKRQEIYAFNRADARFLAYADECFPTAQPWVRIDHRTSYRMTASLASFLNAAVLPPDARIRVPAVGDAGPGPRPRYLVADAMRYDIPPLIPIPSPAHLEPPDPAASPLGGPWSPLDEIARYLSLGIAPSDILVLAPSTRSPLSPARKLANAIALSLPAKVHVADSDSELARADEAARGKVLVCSYHQAKGIERRCVVVLSFDGGYARFYGKKDGAEADATIANAQYVALTRSTGHLTVVQDRGEGPAVGVRLDGVRGTCDVVGGELPLPLSEVPPTTDDPSPHSPDIPSEPSVATVAPTRVRFPSTPGSRIPLLPLTPLLASLPTPLIKSLFSHLELEPLHPASPPLPHARARQCSDGLWEPVGDLVGRGAVLWFEGRRGGKGLGMVQDELRAEKERREREREGLEAGTARRRLVDYRVPGDVRTHLPDALLDEILGYRAEDMGPEAFALLAQVAAALQSSYLPRLVQLERALYDFLPPHVLGAAEELLGSHLSAGAEYWLPLRRMIETAAGKAKVWATADAVDRNTLWAVRWADSVRLEHVLELACLAALDARTDGKVRTTREYRLLNLQTGQVVGLKGDFREVLKRLVEHRLGPGEARAPDAVFREHLRTLFAAQFEARSSVPHWLHAGTGGHAADQTRVFGDAEGRGMDAELSRLVLRKMPMIT